MVRWEMTLFSSPIFFSQNFILQFNYFVTCFFPTLLYVAFLVNKCICATSFFLSCNLSFFFLIIFNWRKIASQYCVGLCHTSGWDSHRYACVSSLFNLPPTPTHPSRLLQSPGLSSLSYTSNSHWLSILHMYISMLLINYFNLNPYFRICFWGDPN